MPGNPVDMVVDRKVSEEKKEQIAHEMGYDRPLVEQYVDWMKNILGRSQFWQVHSI